MSDFWNKANVELLKGLHRDGLSFGAIGRVLKCSRNAAIGKFNRLGLPRGDSFGLRRKATVALPCGGYRKRRAPQFRTVSPAERTEALSLAPLSDADGNPIAVLNVTRDQCRYGYGDPQDEAFRFCGRPTEHDSSWCQHHSSIVFDKILTARSAAKAKASATEHEQRKAA